MIEVDVDYPPLPPGTKTLTVWTKHLSHMPRGHQQLLFIGDARGGLDDAHARSLLDAVLSVEEDSATTDVPPPAAGTAPSTQDAATTAPTTQAAAAAPSAPPHRGINFFEMGVEHITTGYDHLLFLAALLLVCRSFREAASVITFFTVAHSITLTLATLDLVRLPDRIVEPAIAASIVYVALENLFGQHRMLWRAGVTFGFGLVHGLGFASALREVGLGSNGIGIAWPLVKFSVGLETGQLTIAVVALTVLLALRRARPEIYRLRFMPAGSVLVACVGGFWLVSRVLAGP
jgi:hydrogenase/urease accessory protein HupE